MEDIFEIWPSAADLARDIGENEVTVRHWKRRRSIPARFDVAIVEAAARRGRTITFDSLAQARATIASEKRMLAENQRETAQ